MTSLKADYHQKWIYVAVLFCMASSITMCTKPSEPEFNNPYDELGDAFISHPSMNTLQPDSITAISALSGGQFTTDHGYPITERGVCWHTSAQPAIEHSCTSDGSGLGSFTSRLNSLNPDTRYFVRAYAINQSGIEYGEQREFATRDGIAQLSTAEISAIGSTTARSGGIVSDDGGAQVTSRGVCWSTSQNPTTDNTCTSNGSGTGSFSSNLGNLSPDTRYFIRAYATNSAGTAYGNQLSFTTASAPSWPRDNSTAVVDVRNPSTGRIWMDRNLGATRRATSMTDTQAYGDLYQWGRAADGHQRRNSPTTSNLSRTDQPDHGSFILSNSGANLDWRNPQNNNLWQGVNGVNNPCPSGYRLPTDAEWTGERQSWRSNNAAGAFNSPLRLPVTGYRNSGSGSFRNVGSHGNYWSGTVDGTRSRSLFFRSYLASMGSNGRALGLSVRCLKE